MDAAENLFAETASSASVEITEPAAAQKNAARKAEAAPAAQEENLFAGWEEENRG